MAGSAPPPSGRWRCSAWQPCPSRGQSGRGDSIKPSLRARERLALAPSQMQHEPMPDVSPDPLQELLARLREARDAAAQDPFGDPVLLIALAISRRMDDGLLDLDSLGGLVQRLADAAADDRA